MSSPHHQTTRLYLRLFEVESEAQRAREIAEDAKRHATNAAANAYDLDRRLTALTHVVEQLLLALRPTG